MYTTAPSGLLYGTNCNHTKYSAQCWRAREKTKLMVCVLWPMAMLRCSWLRFTARASEALTSAAYVDVQIALDDGAVLQGLSGVHRVNDGGGAGLIAGAIAGTA